MKFYLKDTNIYPIKSNPHMLHLATVGYGLQEFVAMLCVYGPKANNLYIEELVVNSVDWSNDVFGNFKFIDDNNLANDIAAFLNQHQLISIDKIATILGEQKKLGWLSGSHLVANHAK